MWGVLFQSRLQLTDVHIAFAKGFEPQGLFRGWNKKSRIANRFLELPAHSHLHLLTKKSTRGYS